MRPRRPAKNRFPEQPREVKLRRCDRDVLTKSGSGGDENGEEGFGDPNDSARKGEEKGRGNRAAEKLRNVKSTDELYIILIILGELRIRTFFMV